jgi:hypothetical protein
MESEFSWIDTIRYATIASSLIPFVVYLILIRQMPKQNHIIGLIVIISAACELIALNEFNHGRPTVLLSNIYFTIFFLLACWFYYEILFKAHNTGYFYLGLAIYCISFSIVAINIHGMFEFQSEAWALGGLILVAFGILYTNRLMEKPAVPDQNFYSVLFINGGIFLYFSFNFFLFAVANYMLTETERDIGRMTWAFHNVNNIIKNIAFALGLYYTNRKKIDLLKAERDLMEWSHLKN